MKRQNKLVKPTYEMGLEILRLREKLPEDQDRIEVLFDIVKETVKMCAGISTATDLGIEDDYIRNKLLPKTLSRTYQIEVLLEISMSLGYIDNIEKYLKVIEKVRAGLEEMIYGPVALADRKYWFQE
jgi:hypothetical protein